VESIVQTMVSLQEIQITKRGITENILECQNNAVLRARASSDFIAKKVHLPLIRIFVNIFGSGKKVW
jgi:hypothetical protein